MKRRIFITHSAAACSLAILNPLQTMATKQISTTIVAHGKSFESLTREALGLIDFPSGHQLKRARVLLKTAMAWNQPPGSGYNSDPELVKFLVSYLVAKGAKEVSVFDQCYDNWTECYRISGIERVVKDATGRVYPANDFRYYEVFSPSGLRVHQTLLRADIVINLSVVTGRVTPRTEGAVSGYLRSVWNFQNCWHQKENNCLSALLTFRQPDITIAEVWSGAESQNAPAIPLKKGLVISRDLLQADLEAASLTGISIDTLPGVDQLLSEKLWRIHPDLARTIHL